MNRKLLLASAGAAVVAAAGFGSIALAQEDTPSEPPAEQTGGPSGELDAVPDDAAAGEGQELVEGEGGTVLAECAEEGPELVWWVPAEGFTVDDVEAAPHEDDDEDDGDAEIEFTDGSTEVDYDVTCAEGQPQAEVTSETDDEDDDREDDGDDPDDEDDD